MKRCLLLLVLSFFCSNAEDQDQVHVLIMQSPAKFIDREELVSCAQAWAEKYVDLLNESETKVVARTLHIGKVFSGVDLKMRTLVQSMLVTICSMYQVVTNGGEDSRLSQELESEIQEFSKIKGMHSIMLHEWQAWTNVLSTADNKQISEALEAVNDAIRLEIEKALSHKEWQMLTAHIPSAAQETIKKLTLLSALCSAMAQKEGNEAENQDAATLTADSVMLFDMIARAAENGCQRSFETIEASSQILLYETMLLEMSYMMFDAYLEAIQGSQEG